ncbi:MAG: hypothetical protein PHY64_00235 [Eubacteriales bacterium]|nr:hypothetical protein [Eubacteriales bacterium]
MDMDNYYPYNAIAGDRTHDADDLARIIAAVLTNGVIMISATDLQVLAAGDFNIKVKAGSCVAKGRFGINIADKTFTLTAPFDGMDRIDRIVARADYANRKTTLLYLEGTPDDVPEAPALKNDADGYDIPLARIAVASSAAAITQSVITDERVMSSVAMPNDLATLMAQAQDAFDSWFTTVQATLDGDAAGNLLNLITALSNSVVKYTEDMNLSNADKARFRKNIGAGSASPNLLINGNFVTPVNQRSRSSGVSYSTVGTYYLDMWKLIAGSVKWTLNTGLYLPIGAEILQYFEIDYNELLGQGCMFTVQDSNGDYLSIAGSFPEAVNEADAEEVYTLPGVGTITLGFNYRAGGVMINEQTQYYVPYISIETSSEITLRHAKLELGEESTLSYDKALSYIKSYLACARYYWRGEVENSCGYYFADTGWSYQFAGSQAYPVLPRIEPTVTILTTPTYTRCSTVSVSSSTRSMVILRVTTTGSGQYRAISGVYEASAEL